MDKLRILLLAFVCGLLSAPTFAVPTGALQVGDILDTTEASLGGPPISPSFRLGEVAEIDHRSLARASEVLSGLAPDSFTARGVTDERVYAKAAPAVVMVFTNDALGSGSLITANGEIVTKLHVVGNNRTVKVILKPRTEGAEYTQKDVRWATVVRRDQVADLALVKLEAVPSNLPTISLGSMADVAVGEDVHAIGHPTGEAWTYTRGIVSQVRQHYTWKADDGIAHTAFIIQTQTPINPGNSGGPLLNDSGELLGVNSFKAEGEGLNFAVSVDDVRHLLSLTSDRMVVSPPSHASVKSQCQPKYYRPTRRKDPPGMAQLVDLDCSGKPDAVLFIPDDTSKPITMGLDTKHDGKISGMLVDTHRTGTWDTSYWDTTGSGKLDLKCYHVNGNPKPSRCEKYNA